MEESVRTMIVRFEVPGEPKGKARPRIYQNKHTGKSQAITPKDTLSYENIVRWVYSSTPGVKVLDGEIEAHIIAYYSIPKSMTKKNRKLIEEGKLHPTKKPDADNVAKIVLDALNNIAYKDDSQVVKLIVEKHYSDNPRVYVVLSEMGK